MNRLRPFSRLALQGSLVLGSCGGTEARDDGPDRRILHFDTVTVRLVTGADTVPLHVELAVSPQQQQLGLMERLQLDSLAGMLFVYDSLLPADAGFWMYRTRIPLDIAYLDSAGVIGSIRVMQPCSTTMPQGCPVYVPGVPFRYALELNAGSLERFGADTGSRLLLEDLPDTLRSR